MALVDPPKVKGPPLFRVVPTLLASAVAVLVFVVALAVVARATADDASVPPPRDLADAVDGLAGIGDVPDGGLDGDVPDGGLDGGVLDGGVLDGGVLDGGVLPDAGVLDAGPSIEVVTVSPDAGPIVDGGPATVEGPPYEPMAVAAAAVVLVEACAVDARRWDPSLGGAFTLRVTLPALPEVGAPPVRPVVVADGLRSPVLEACMARRLGEVVLPAGASDLLQQQQVEARASLSTSGRVEVSAVAVVAVP